MIFVITSLFYVTLGAIDNFALSSSLMSVITYIVGKMLEQAI